MAKTPALTVSLDAAPNAAEGVTFLQTAQALTITDKASHGVCRQFLKDAKALRRTIAEHYAKIKKPLNEARNTVLDMEKQHLAPIDEAIALAERSDVAFVREQQRIEQAETDRRRREAEAAEQARRDEDAAKAEAEASALEASSEALSERERTFIRLVLNSDRSHRAETNAAKVAGYKDPAAMADRLMKSHKIQAAMAQAEQAAAIRRQSEAKQDAPILVDVAPVASEVATVAGTSLRTYYGCDSQVDLKVLAQAVLDGKVPVEAIQPNMVYLNAQARMLKATFPGVYPGCKLASKDGITG